MKTFDIIGPDEAIRPALVEKINNLTKPKGSLGMLESLALQVGLIQQSLTPTLQHPQNIIFAADPWYCLRGRCQPLTQRNYLAANQ